MMRKSRRLFAQLPHFDVCVIGGGPAGVSAALRAVDYNKKVCLIEKGRIGGADLWDGALQSKTLWEMSKFVDRVRTFGPQMFPPQSVPRLTNISNGKIRNTLAKTSTERESQLLQALKHADVRLVSGVGSFADTNTVEVAGSSGDKYTITADYFVIATGSVPRRHPQYPSDGTTIVTSDDIMRLDLPESVVIVGAGVIGCEFASILANFGMTKVSIIEKAKRMLPNEDDDVALFVEGLLKKKGVTFHHETQLANLEVMKDANDRPFARYGVRHNVTKEVVSFDVAKALICIGRDPNYSQLALSNIGVELDHGKLRVDKWGRCAPHNHIYAVGDATVDIALVNKGESEGICAINHMFSVQPEEVTSIDNLSTIMFLDEEVAGVGLSELQCRKRNIAYCVANYGYNFVSRAVAMGNPNGFVKIIVTNDARKTVLGVRAVGAHASSVVELASLAIHRKASAYDLSEMAVAYPAVTQGFQECIRLLLGRSILKADVFPALTMSSWTPPDFGRGALYQKEAAATRVEAAKRKYKATGSD